MPAFVNTPAIHQIGTPFISRRACQNGSGRRWRRRRWAACDARPNGAANGHGSAVPPPSPHSSTAPVGAPPKLPEGHFARSSPGLKSSRGGVLYPEGEYDVIVIGAGHAGCEAALASARLGARTLLLTLNLDRIAWQPCNPAVGGPAKSTLVHEVDALGGWIGKLADRTYLQRRVLNRSKGPSVWALRAQTDKREYSVEMRRVLESAENLEIREGMVYDLALGPNDEVCGVETYFGGAFKAPAVVLTTGTFLGGTIWVGNKSMPAGRAGEPSSFGLTETLSRLGFETGRLKTGTPARVDSRTVNYAVMQPQPSDPDDHWFSYDPLEWNPRTDTMMCHLTRTTEQTHSIIRDNLHLTPKYGGHMQSTGPRYCPSVEDKVVRFAERDSHPIFIEPEGRTIPEVYVQGLSTGMPESVQLAMLQSIPGLEQCRMVRPAYSVDYDYIPGIQVFDTLHTKKAEGLFMAGQLLGTTGYEEAAAQGIVAGVNAARYARQRRESEMIRFGRETSFIGVMIDDLCTKELREPYRVLTSRAEFRLLLRPDNADRRLTPIGRQLGLIDDRRWQVYQERQQRLEREMQRLERRLVRDTDTVAAEIAQGGHGEVRGAVPLAELLKRPQITMQMLQQWGLSDDADPALTVYDREAVEVLVKYAGYLVRQEEDVQRMKVQYDSEIPRDLDYTEIQQLSKEGAEQLMRVRPTTVGQASRIGGVKPTDVWTLLIWLNKRTRETAGEKEPVTGGSYERVQSWG